jgi:spore germination cell wall hydrolase CwlJ-like protein
MRQLTIVVMITLMLTVLGLYLENVVPEGTKVIEEVSYQLTPPPIKILYDFTDKEITCLAQNVYYEARGENIIGQQAVAEVTLNRWKRHQPKTLCDIIFQRNDTVCQFSWVCDTNRGTPHQNSPAWITAINIAWSATHGETCQCELEEAIYFHAVYTQPSWSRTQIRLKQIGNHVFYAAANN